MNLCAARIVHEVVTWRIVNGRDKLCVIYPKKIRSSYACQVYEHIIF